MLIFTFIMGSLMLLFTGGAVLFLYVWNQYEDALVTLIAGVIMTAIIVGIPLAVSKENQRTEKIKMEENSYITIDFTEEEIDEILVEYYGLDTEYRPDKEWLEEAKTGLSEDDIKRIVLKKML